jgi:hypothetical protein
MKGPVGGTLDLREDLEAVGGPIAPIHLEDLRGLGSV